MSKVHIPSPQSITHCSTKQVVDLRDDAGSMSVLLQEGLSHIVELRVQVPSVGDEQHQVHFDESVDFVLAAAGATSC